MLKIIRYLDPNKAHGHDMISIRMIDKILNIITDFLSFTKQRFILNVQASPWVSIEAGVPQGSILGPLLLLIYINDLSDDLSSTVKSFADDTSLFSIVQNVNTSASHLDSDLSKISN